MVYRAPLHVCMHRAITTLQAEADRGCPALQGLAQRAQRHILASDAAFRGGDNLAASSHSQVAPVGSFMTYLLSCPPMSCCDGAKAVP